MSDLNAQIAASEDSTKVPPPNARGKRAGGLWSRLRAMLLGMDRRQRLLMAIAALVFLIVLIVAVLIWYLIFRQPVSELPGLGVTIPPRYSYSISGVERPLGVAVDEGRGRLYITQSDGGRTVAVFDLAGARIGELAAPTPSVMHTPTHVAVDESSGDVYVSDRATLSLYRYSSGGELLGVIKPAGVTDWSPLAVIVAPDGSLFVSDSYQDRQLVWHLNADGEVLARIGAADGLSFANGLALLEDGSVLVADSNNSRVLLYDAAGKLVDRLARGEADAPMGLPRGLALGSGGRLYVVDTVNDVVRVYRTKDGATPEYGTSFGEFGNLDGQFLFPNGIAADHSGHIYVTDRENNRVQVWTNQ